MNQPLLSYFKQEKIESITFLGLGFLTLLIASSTWLLLVDSFYQGMAIPLAIMGMIELIMGIIGYSRSDRQFALLLDKIQQDPSAFVKQERQRMMRVIRNFDLFRWTGLTLCFVGIGMLLASLIAPEAAFWTGLGLGLFLQSAILLTLDILAKKRAGKYYAWIEDLKQSL